MRLPDEVLQDIEMESSVLLLIDMQRRHLDMEQGYHTLPPHRAEIVLRNGARAVAAARAAGTRIVHVGTWSRHRSAWGPVDGGNPFMKWQTGRNIPGSNFVRQSGKCVEGSVYAEFMPGISPENNEPVVLKWRYSGFYATDLERVLRTLGVKTVFLAGVNTNNCVLSSAFDAHARDFRVVLLEDACGSMNGDDYHKAAVQQIEAALGWTYDVESFERWTRTGRDLGGAGADTRATPPAGHP